MPQKTQGKKLLLCQPLVEKSEPQPPWAWWRKTTELAAETGTTVDVGGLRKAYSGITTYEEGYGGIQMALRAHEAEKNGYDAFIIGCSSDMGLKECRALVNIPVVAPTESTVLLASTLGYKFSTINLQPSTNAGMENAIKNTGLISKLASMRCSPELTHAKTFDMMFGNEKEKQKLTDLLTAEISKAVTEDGAEAVFVTCTVTSSFLTMRGIREVAGAPVLDLYAAALKLAETLVDLKRAYGTAVCKRSIYLGPAAGWEKEVSV